MKINQLIFIETLVIFCVMSSCEKSTSHPLYIEGGGVFDSEGNYYETVIIGDQEWMSENLRTDLFSNGDSIPYSGTDRMVIIYDDDPLNEEVFGKLYNYEAVLDTLGLCPCGWHVPTELEYAILINYLGGYEDAWLKMKSTGSIDRGDGLWIEKDSSGTTHVLGNNSSGFNAIPAGRGFYSISSSYSGKHSSAVFWAVPTSGTDAIMFRMGNNTPYIEKVRFTIPYTKEYYYYSIRCIKNL